MSLLPHLWIAAETDNTSLPSDWSPIYHFINNLHEIYQYMTSGSILCAKPWLKATLWSRLLLCVSERERETGMVQGPLLFCPELVVPSCSENSYFSLFHHPSGTLKWDDGDQTGRGRRGALQVPPRHACPEEGAAGAVHPTVWWLGRLPPQPLSLLSALPRRGLTAILPHHRWSLATARACCACNLFMSTALAPTAAAPSSAMARAVNRPRRAGLGPRFPSQAPRGRLEGWGLSWHQGTRLAMGPLPLVAGCRRWGAVAWRSLSAAITVRVVERRGPLCTWAWEGTGLSPRHVLLFWWETISL